jgi:hypothetical protein
MVISTLASHDGHVKRGGRTQVVSRTTILLIISYNNALNLKFCNTLKKKDNPVCNPKPC